MVPNYAYGQDVGNAFKPYFLTLVPDGEIVDEQFPEFDEDDFTPFINAMLAAEPDGILSAFFSTSIVPFMNQWKAAGRDGDIPVISGLANLDFDNAVTDPNSIPENFYGYDRGNYSLLENNPVAAEYIDLWIEAYGDEYRVPDSFPFQVLSSWTMLQALVEQSGSLEPEDWKTLIESGTFAFEGPYNEGPTYVNPINHMADTCASVGRSSSTTRSAPPPTTPSRVVGRLHARRALDRGSAGAHGQRRQSPPRRSPPTRRQRGRRSHRSRTTGDRDTAGRPPAVSRFRPIL